MKIPISAKIDEDVLQYCKANGGKLNKLINDLLRGWMNKNQEKQLIAFQVETEKNELRKMSNKQICIQCCNNCEYSNNTYCIKNNFNIETQDRPKNKFCCIYWEKKKGSN